MVNISYDEIPCIKRYFRRILNFIVSAVHTTVHSKGNYCDFFSHGKTYSGNSKIYSGSSHLDWGYSGENFPNLCKVWLLTDIVQGEDDIKNITEIKEKDFPVKILITSYGPFFCIPIFFCLVMLPCSADDNNSDTEDHLVLPCKMHLPNPSSWFSSAGVPNLLEVVAEFYGVKSLRLKNIPFKFLLAVGVEGRSFFNWG